MSPGYRGCGALKGGAEVHSVVGLGSGSVHIPAMVKHFVVRLT